MVVDCDWWDKQKQVEQHALSGEDQHPIRTTSVDASGETERQANDYVGRFEHSDNPRHRQRDGGRVAQPSMAHHPAPRALHGCLTLEHGGAL